MVAIYIELFITGDKFILNDFVGNCHFTEEMINQDKSNIDIDVNNNILIICHPKIHTKYYDEEYEYWYLKFLESYHSKLVQFGADDFRLNYTSLYVKQCNIEIFDSKLLKKFSKYNVSIPFSCIKYSQKDMKKLAKKYNFEYEE